MAKRISQLEESKRKELQGLESFIDDFQREQDNIERLRNQKEREKKADQYELITYFEEEFSRLNKLDLFYSKKHPTQMNFSQSDKIYQLQSELQKEKENMLINLFDDEHSPFRNNLESLFNAHFKS